MSYIKVELNYPIEDGTQITFKAPAANTAVEGLKVYYPSVTDSAVTTTSKTFTFVDSANAPFFTKNITAFAADSYVNVILNLTDSLAYVQSPTNNTVIQGLMDTVTTLATTYATTSKAGIVKVGNGLSVTSDGTLSSDISTATKDTAGVIKVGDGLSVTSDGTVSSNVSSTTKSFTLSSASWSNSRYTISDSLITATSNQEILPAVGITSDQMKALQLATIVDAGQSAGHLTIKALGIVPSIDIPIRIIFRGTI